ncbi:MAG: hypothetical protein IKL07_00630, partial [Clostridium sp.]|nr:hypothetical protein [Clostridium sp.]
MSFPCERVADIKEVKEHNYVLQSGHGVTQLITKVLFDTIETIKENPGVIDKLVVILDSEELDIATRREQVYQKIDEKYCRNELDFDIEVLVVNHCFETWLLGRVDLYPKEPVDEGSFFYPYYSYYNVEKNDPEYMSVPKDIEDSIVAYHFHYL